MSAWAPAWAQAQAQLAAPRSLTVVIDDSYPPYVFRDQAGRLQGIRKDVWDLWSARTGIKVHPAMVSDWLSPVFLLTTSPYVTGGVTTACCSKR